MRLEARGINAGYGREIVLLNVDFALPPGQFVGLIGPNGAGKSTLLRALSRVLPLRDGKLLLDGRPAESFTAREVALKIAFVAQTESALFDFSVRDVVLMGRNPHINGRAHESARDFAESARAMSATDTLQLAERPVTTLSGGEFRRVLIARAFAQSTPTLLLDEPTAHLDLTHQLDILSLVRRQVDAEGASCLAALHDLNLAAAFCDRLVLIAGGQIMADGPVSEVLSPNVLARAFGPGIAVTTLPGTTTPVVLPAPPEPDFSGLSHRIHVVCGGGSSAEILSLLHRRGHTVTAGVLNRTDSDQLACEALGIEHIAESPFSAIGQGAIAACRALMEQAEVIVITDVPFGHGNMPNLLLTAQLQAMGKLVCLVGAKSVEERDFTGGEARKVFDQLAGGGALAIPEVRALESFLASIPPAPEQINS